MMGYDRTSIMFSPDGRLLQVEYAREAVKQGSLSIGIRCKDGVLIVVDKRITESLIVPEAIEKVFQIDKHIGATATGCVMDGRVLIEKAQLIAQQHRVTYDVPIDTVSLVKEICDIKQLYTQLGGARPFGVSLMFIGVDDRPRLLVTDPIGIYFEYKATAIGEGEVEAKKMLEKEYNENITIEEGIKLAIKIMKKVLGKEFNLKRIDGAYVDLEKKQFTKINKKKIKW